MASRLWLTAGWSAGCAALALLSALVFAHDLVAGPAAAWAPLLEWRAADAWRQPWRAWTSALVHYSPQHLAANLAGCAVVAAFGTAARLPVRAIVAAAAAWPLTQILLLWAPSLSAYAGLSGVLHAAVAVAAVALVLGGAARQRWIGAAVWLGLLVKVVLEAPWSGAVQTVPGWDIPVAVAAHASGLISGSFMMGLVALYSASRSSTPRPRQSV